MPYVAFHEYFPALARKETRSVTVLPYAAGNVPAGHYGFIEMFCDEPGCDCRRVFLMVLSSPANRPEAVTRKLIVFKHDSALGSAPAHKLFDLFTIKRKDESKPPRQFSASRRAPCLLLMPGNLRVQGHRL